MAYTTPITWTVGQTVTAAQLNQQIRDNETFMIGRHGCGLGRTTDPSLTTGTDTAVSWDAEDWNSEGTGLHSTSTNPTRIIVPTGFAGAWRFSCGLFFASNATGARQVWLRKNGTTTVGGMSVPAGSAAISVIIDRILILAVADYIEIMANQNSGGALNLLCNSTTFGAQATHTSWAEAQFIGF